MWTARPRSPPCPARTRSLLAVTFEASPGAERPDGSSVVTFLIEPHADVVRLTVTHENLPDAEMLRRMSSGWPAALREVPASKTS